MAAEESDKPPDGKCRHYWIIQPATGPVSQGSCQTCGLTREFENYVEAHTWGDEHRKYKAPKRFANLDGDEGEEEEELVEGDETFARPMLLGRIGRN